MRLAHLGPCRIGSISFATAPPKDGCMSIAEKLNEELKDAMRCRDQKRLACIRQVKAKVQEASNVKGFEGALDDPLYQGIITTYIKSLRKGIEELEAAGARGEQLRGKYQYEIGYLEQYLPKQMTEDEVLSIVKAAIASKKISDPKQAGQVTGMVMKEHKGEVDAGLVRRLSEQELSRLAK